MDVTGISQSHSTECYIDVLPDEVLADIQSIATRVHLMNKDRYGCPSIFCRVSRRWKGVACCNPRIWSFIFIADDRGIQHLPTRLARSGNVPLDIKIEDPNDILDHAPIMDQLVPLGDRWFSVDIKVGDITRYAKYFPKGLPLLQCIMLYDTGAPFTLATSFPNLRFMKLHKSWFFCDPAISLSHLAELRLVEGDSNEGHHMPLEKFLCYLRNASNLEVLELTESWFFDSVSDEQLQALRSKVVELPILRALRLDELYAWETVAFLSCVRATAVQSLYLSIMPNDNLDLAESLQVAQLHLDFPDLHILTLKNLGIPTLEIMHILSQIPEIQTLSLLNMDTDRITFETLMFHPRLAKLTARLSELFTRGIALSELHRCFSTPSIPAALRHQLKLKVHNEDLASARRYPTPNDPLVELGILVPSFMGTDDELEWDNV